MAKFKFKVGDKVVIKDDLNFHNFENGEVVVIKEVDKYGGYTGYRVGDSPESWMCFDDREIEEYKEEVKVQKFKVGDRVRMIEKGQYSFDSVGNTGTVIGVASDSLLEITVDGEDCPIFCKGWTYWVENENWEVIEEESKMTKFKVGDKVVIKDNESHHEFQNGDVVVITMVDRGTYRGHKVGDDPAGWWAFGDREIEEYKEEKEMPKCKFKVGDLVKGNDPRRYFYTNDKMTKGVVLEVHNHDDIKVKILEHTVSVVVGDAYNVDPQYFDFYEEPKLVQNEKPKATVLKLGEYKIVFNGDTTVVTDGVGKGVAKRHPDDEYDAVVGLQVAIERFNGGTRKPKIGDKVRVLKVDEGSRYGRHSYSIGDIVTVTGFAHYYANTDICCKDSYGFKQTLTASEYEVLG